MIKAVTSTLVNLIKILFSLILSLYIALISFYCASNKIDWQVILFLIFSAFVLGLIWYIAFSKIRLKKKVILSLIFIIWLFSPKIIPNVMNAIDIDICLDNGGCWDDIRNRCEYKHQGMCVKDSEDCNKKWHGTWNDKDQFCVLNKK